MFYTVLNASLVFYEGTILRITFVGSFFVLKLKVACPQHYSNNSATDNFLGIF